MDDFNNRLNTIKKIDWDGASVSFFVVKRTLKQREAKYNTFNVNVDKALLISPTA